MPQLLPLKFFIIQKQNRRFASQSVIVNLPSSWFAQNAGIMSWCSKFASLRTLFPLV